MEPPLKKARTLPSKIQKQQYNSTKERISALREAMQLDAYEVYITGFFASIIGLAVDRWGEDELKLLFDLKYSMEETFKEAKALMTASTNASFRKEVHTFVHTFTVPLHEHLEKNTRVGPELVLNTMRAIYDRLQMLAETWEQEKLIAKYKYKSVFHLVRMWDTLFRDVHVLVAKPNAKGDTDQRRRRLRGSRYLRSRQSFSAESADRHAKAR